MHQTPVLWLAVLSQFYSVPQLAEFLSYVQVDREVQQQAAAAGQERGGAPYEAVCE